MWFNVGRSFVAQGIKLLHTNLCQNFHWDWVVRLYTAIQLDQHHTRDNICLALPQHLCRYIQQVMDHSSPLQMFVLLHNSSLNNYSTHISKLFQRGSLLIDHEPKAELGTFHAQMTIWWVIPTIAKHLEGRVYPVEEDIASNICALHHQHWGSAFLP